MQHRSASSIAAVPLVPASSFGVQRSGTQPAQLFQPSLPSATGLPQASQPLSSTAESASAVDASHGHTPAASATQENGLQHAQQRQKSAHAIHTSGPYAQLQNSFPQTECGTEITDAGAASLDAAATAIQSARQGSPHQDEAFPATYTSFSHDSMPNYTLTSSALAYNASGNMLAPFDAGSQSVAVIPAHMDHDPGGFNDMTELQF